MRHLKCLYFNPETGRVETADIPTEIPVNESVELKRFPCYEAVLGPNADIQECRVTLANPGRQFIVVAQYKPNVPHNGALAHALPDYRWTGSMLVLKAGLFAFVVNLRPDEHNQAVQAAKQ